MINTGGYKVNPTEVEHSLRQIKEIADAFVFGKKNSLLGNIVSCEIISLDKSLTEKQIRQFLQLKLQEFKIPRIIKFVDKINSTRTGKISRNIK
jgi:acyl-coenzyme A synthetase/AMP-(fatty) acid ligase